MKPFHLYREPPPSAPTRLASEVSLDEQSQLCEAFRGVANKFRRHKQLAKRAMIGFFGAAVTSAMAGGVLHTTTLAFGFMLLAILFWTLAFVCGVTAPALACPSCGNDLTFAFGRFCPECGADNLPRASWFPCTKCDACGKVLKYQKGRRYKIRTCTCCGLALDRERL
jgi:hypothetical protein